MSADRELAAVHRPLYARLLRLHALAPSGLLCFIFLEGAIALGILLALAELVSWWGVIVLPLTVALMVKLNDLIAAQLARPPVPTPRTTARAAVLRPAAGVHLAEEATTRLAGPVRPGAAFPPTANQAGEPLKRSWAERREIRDQRARQSANRRYE
jgi:hypothetical protein